MSRVLLADSSSDGEGGYGRFARSGDDVGDHQTTRRWCRPAALACCAAAPLAVISIAALIGHVRLQHDRPQRSLGGRLPIINDANAEQEKGSLLPASDDTVQHLRGPQGGHMSPPVFGAPVEIPMEEAFAAVPMTNDSVGAPEEVMPNASGNATEEAVSGTAEATASDATSTPVAVTTEAVPAVAALEVPLDATTAMPSVASMSDLPTTPAPANETSSNATETGYVALEKPVEEEVPMETHSSSNDSVAPAAAMGSVFGTMSETPSEVSVSEVSVASAAPEEGTPAKSSLFKMPKVAEVSGADKVKEEAAKKASVVEKKAIDGLAGMSGTVGAAGNKVKTEALKEVAGDHSVADLQAADGVMKKLGKMANASETISGDSASVVAVQEAAQAVLANEDSLLKAADDTTGGKLGKITESVDANGDKVAVGLTTAEDKAKEVAPDLKDAALQAAGGGIPGDVQDTLKPVAGEAAKAGELGEAAAAKLQEGGSPMEMLHDEAVKGAASVDNIKEIAANAEGNVGVAAKLGQEVIGPEDMANMEDAVADDAFQVGDTLESVAEGVKDGQVPNLDDAEAAAGPAAEMVAGQVPPDVVKKVSAAEAQVEAATKTAEAASEEAQAAVIEVASAEKEVEAAADKVPDDVKKEIDSIEKRAKDVIPKDVEKSVPKPKDIMKVWR